MCREGEHNKHHEVSTQRGSSHTHNGLGLGSDKGLVGGSLCLPPWPSPVPMYVGETRGRIRPDPDMTLRYHRGR